MGRHYSSQVRFEVLASDPRSGLRAGVLHTPHGDVPTPAFMPVGTRATVKALTPADVRATGARVVLSNTYHLLLEPGVQVVERLGGLHGFMRWDGPILTDSGGFQVFSLGDMRVVSDEGVWFSDTLLTPECVIEAEERLGGDLIMPLDECVAADASRDETERALERTHAWWKRSVRVQRRTDQALFALIQGGMFPDLRRQAARAASASGPPGFAIGGLSVGEPKSLTAELLQTTLAELPPERPRYVMGVGHPRDLATYAALGADLFDCVLPTRLGRNGTVWIDEQGTRLDLGRRATLRMDGPILVGCACPACQGWSIGGLAALYQAREQLAYRLASVHNVQVLVSLLDDLRQQVVYTASETAMSERSPAG
jgi:queuine tRNA-ribosyltransferase